MKSLLAVAHVALLSSITLACNTKQQLNFDSATPFNSHNGLGSVVENVNQFQATAPLTLLPQNSGNMSPACLDGSPYGFYFVPSTTGSKEWTISIEGGGWCYDEQECYSRSQMNLGSSKAWGKEAGCACMNANKDGPVADCNCLYMPYGDGASFSGYRPDPWPVPGMPGKNLTFRGIVNLDATLDWAFEHGLSEATEFVLTGGSAGGLSTFLHMDRVAAQIRQRSSTIQKIVGAPVVGYFLDHDNFAHSHGQPNTPSWNKENYTGWMKYIYQMQNLTFGNDGGLTSACEQEHPTEPWLCFMSPHMNDVIDTPFFVFNSKYDHWQLQNEFQSVWTTKKEQEGVLQYGRDFLIDFAPVQKKKKNGAFITSCICHGCPWNDPTALAFGSENINPWEAYGRWYTGADEGEDAIHIDPRLPNGGGNITNVKCFGFPEKN